MPATEHGRLLGPGLCEGVGLPHELGMPDKVSLSKLALASHVDMRKAVQVDLISTVVENRLQPFHAERRMDSWETRIAAKST